MRRLPFLALSLLATGCTQVERDYPSLLPRPIESLSTAEPERPAPVAEPDPALDRQVAALSATADTASQAFANRAGTAEAAVAVARGTAEGSERWIAAQTAMAELGSTRAPLLQALSELEQLAIARGRAGLPPYPALDAAVARFGADAEAQQRRITGLEAALRGE